MTEEEYEQEMYRRLKTELNATQNPREREERIARHIREMARLSPSLFRLFMAKNASNLSMLAQPDHVEELAPKPEQTERELGGPRSILKKDQRAASASPDRSPSPTPPQPLSNIEKVICALRKGGTKPQQEKKGEAESGKPPAGSLKQLSSYMDVEEEEEFLYGDGSESRPAAVPEPTTAVPATGDQPGSFWSAPRLQPVDLAPLYEEAPKSKGAAPPPSGPNPFELFSKLTQSIKKQEPTQPTPSTTTSAPNVMATMEEKEKGYEQWRAAVFQKGEEKKEKASDDVATKPTTIKGNESAEELSATVENILKSIGFNFELSQRMQELAKQRKEGEKDAIMINQSASFMGAEAQAIQAKDLSDLFVKEEEADFLKSFEQAKLLAREKAKKAREMEERHLKLRNPSLDKDGEKEPRKEKDRDARKTSERESRRDSGRSQRDSDRSHDRDPRWDSDKLPEGSGRTRRDSEGFGLKEGDKRESGGRPRKASESASALSRYDLANIKEHSPYDPSVQDYQHPVATYKPDGKKQQDDFDGLYEGIDDYLYSDKQKSARLSKLDDRDPSRSKMDTDRSDRPKMGERILIVKRVDDKKEERKSRVDSPGSDTSFSRRIVLPPKEKAKVTLETKKRPASPPSPRQSKHSRRSPSPEDKRSDRYISSRPESSKTDRYRKDSDSRDEKARSRSQSRSPERKVFHSKFKYVAPKTTDGTVTDTTKSRLGLDPLKAKIRQELALGKGPKEAAQSIQLEMERAAKVAADKARLLERKKKLLVLGNELEALRQQHNELLRKRRRQKDAHKDPLLVENSRLQDEISAQIQALREGKDLPLKSDGKQASAKGKPAPGDAATQGVC
jgi:hypothetical protein